MVYLIGIKDDFNPCGNNGLRILKDTHNINFLRKRARESAKIYSLDEVYMTSIYTQEMCERSNKEFVAYVRKVGKLLYKKGGD